MERNIDLNEISDGRSYTANDMVRADCQGCEGCSVCCHGMGKSILLDPLDAHRICTYFRIPFEALLADHVELNVVDGMILPNLKMAGEDEHCIFLNQEGRCGIHKIRPGFCRLFPLGRQKFQIHSSDKGMCENGPPEDQSQKMAGYTGIRSV